MSFEHKLGHGTRPKKKGRSAEESALRPEGFASLGRRVEKAAAGLDRSDL
jgi:hypothetical protein